MSVDMSVSCAGRRVTRLDTGRLVDAANGGRRGDRELSVGRAATCILVADLYRRMPDARITDILLEVDDAPPPAAASPAPAPPESSGSYRASGGRLQGCPRRVWHFIAGSPSGAGDAELAGADGAACPDRCTSSFDCRWRGCLRRAGLVHLAVTQS